MRAANEMKALASTDWAEKLKDIVRDPSLLDRMGSSDLKRAGKMLVGALNRVGERAARAEQDLARVTARNLELTGGRPPSWSYLHREAVELLHEYTGFEARRTSNAWTVFGIDSAGGSHALYEYDFAGLGMTQSASASRLMVSHLRQSFLPRTQEQPQ